MEDMNAEYGNYWDTKLFLDDEELNSFWAMPDDPIVSCSYESSSPEGIASNIIMERNRRRKFNDSLYALRSVVPNITKMDKASIIKDAIECIQQLQREEKNLVAEVGEMEQQSSASASIFPQSTEFPNLRKKRVRMAEAVGSSPAAVSRSIDVTELSVCDVGERTLVASIACRKKKGTMIRLSQVIESLDLKVITASFTSLSGTLLHTLFIEADDLANSEELKGKIETAIAEFNFS